ncbi:MAG: ureidoglycolate lyase [Pseudomonadales bacterium]|jgi:ureidoglycolate lyase
MPVTPKTLTASAFAPYGDVIQLSSAKEEREINDGNTIRYHDLAQLSLAKDAGTPLVNIFRSTPVARPITLRSMEYHPLSSQAFYPLSNNPYLVVVAPKGEFDESKVEVFLASASQGVNYHPGTWHHYSLALNSISDFLVIDRGGPEENCEEVTLSKAIEISLDDLEV